MQAGYRILEHPSDLGIEAWGQNVKEAFEQGVQGLVSSIVDPATVASSESRLINSSGDNYETLLVKLLSEVLYLFDGERFLTTRAEIDILTPKTLQGRLLGEQILEGKHHLRLDVKAITYHQLSVRETADGALLTVYVDI